MTSRQQGKYVIRKEYGFVNGNFHNKCNKQEMTPLHKYICDVQTSQNFNIDLNMISVMVFKERYQASYAIITP